MFIKRPHHYISLILCTAAYDFDLDGTPKILRTYVFYIIRIVIYSTVFVIGNFFVTKVLYTRPLDTITFLLANTLLIALTIYIMVWTVVYKHKYVNILIQFKDEHLQLQEWVEVSLIFLYYILTCGTVMYGSNYNLYVVLQYAVVFMSPDVLNYSAVYHFANVVTLLKRKFIKLNRDTLNGADLNNIILRYQALHRITVKVNNMYGLLSLWTVITFFMWIMIDLYRFLNDIIKHQVEDDGIILGNLFATGFHYFTLLYLAVLCNSTKLHYLNFRIVYLRAVLKRRVQVEKKRICLSLFHQNVQFSALDWFEIDYPLIYGITGAVITYLVLFQQLHL